MDSEQKENTIQTLKELRACFSAWESDVRVLGNVKASDAIDAIDISLCAIDRVSVHYRYNPPI